MQVNKKGLVENTQIRKTRRYTKSESNDFYRIKFGNSVIQHDTTISKCDFDKMRISIDLDDREGIDMESNYGKA